MTSAIPVETGYVLLTLFSKFPKRDAKDLFCLLMLSSGLEAERLPFECQRLLGEFALKVGFTGQPGQTTLSQAISAYFTDWPLDPQLLAEFRRWGHAATGLDLAEAVSLRGPIRG